MVSHSLEAELTRARALSMSLKQMLACAQDLEDKHQPVGCAIFLADELYHQLERIEDAARGWRAPAAEGGERRVIRQDESDPMTPWRTKCPGISMRITPKAMMLWRIRQAFGKRVRR